MAVVLWLLSVVITLYALYHVIRSAIDNSETNRLLREIRDQLKEQNEQKERDFRF
jgi:hypothetical protein